ncbi:coiled-coil domain-containing protein 73 [Aulostomus maculatus]
MDLSSDSRTLQTHAEGGGSEIPQELSPSGISRQTEFGGTILLQLLEFKTHLLEVVEELHIRRDAETRFEDQISKLVLGKQELEWEKESLKHQMETLSNQHTESLTNMKKQLQDKIRNLEEEREKYQVIAELKEKETTNLKDELKMLQLLKYNLEKKSSELEQKLALQSRWKDSHLNQMGEVEKRFSALSRQCVMVKQAHEKLEQNVDEAIRINKKLTSTNEKQETAILSLTKELEEVSHKLIKEKMSSVRHDRCRSSPQQEQHRQQLQHKLNVESGMNKRLTEEIATVRAEKQEVMRSLQRSQQLLLSQTQTVSRIELELQTQGEQYQALKQEHVVLREKSKAMEDKVAQLVASHAASKAVWDKEKTMFLDCIKSEQRDLEAVKEAYSQLRRKHMELCVQKRDCSQSISVSTQLIAKSLEGTGGVRPLNEPDSRSMLPSTVSLQNAFSHTKDPDCLEDTRAMTKIIATGATGGQEASSHHQCEEPSSHLSNNSLLCVSGSADKNILNSSVNNCNKIENCSGVVLDLTSAASSVFADELASTGSCVSDRSTNGVVDLETTYIRGDERINWTDESGRDDAKQRSNIREEEGRSITLQGTCEVVQGKDVKQGGCAGGEGGTLVSQTTDRVDSQECTKTENDRQEGEDSDGAEERGKTETDIQASVDNKSDTPQIIDLMDNGETPLVACEDANSSHVSKGRELFRALSCDECPQERQHLSLKEVQTFPESLEVFEETREEKLCDETAEALSQLTSSQINTNGNIQDLRVEPNYPSDGACGTNRTADICGTDTGVTVESRASADQANPLLAESDTQEESQGHTNVICENVPQHMEDSVLKGVCADVAMDEGGLGTKPKGCDGGLKNKTQEEAGDSKTSENDAGLKLPPETSDSNLHKDQSLDEIDDSALPKNKMYRSSFDWSRAKTARSTTTSVSIHLPNAQSSPEYEPRPSGSAGFLGHPYHATFLLSKHNKVPLVITRASDLLNASGVSGTAASTRRHQQGEWKAVGETCKDSAAADKSRDSPSIPSCPASSSSWPTTSGCGSLPTPGGALRSDSDELSCSQEREEQQSSFRAQISKIEQFLRAERLRLPKRRRTDD